MHKLLIASAGIAALLLCSGVAAAQTGPQQAPATPTASTGTVSASAAGQADDPNRIVCKTGPAPTGSRLGATRECHTQREWDLRMQEQQQELTRQQINRGCTAGGC